MKRFLIGITLSIYAGSLLVQAEDIKIPVGEQTPELQQIFRPATGATKTQVKDQFGEPAQETAAKGKPPITSWEYADFIVYFEYEHVIYSVLKPKLHEHKD